MSGNEYFRNIFAVLPLNFLKLKKFHGLTAITAKRSVWNCDAAELMMIPVTPARTTATSTTFRINPEKDGMKTAADYSMFFPRPLMN